MSTKVPITQATIPTPNEDPVSIMQSVLAIKQIVETARGDPYGMPRHAKTATSIAIDAAITHVKNTLP